MLLYGCNQSNYKFFQNTFQCIIPREVNPVSHSGYHFYLYIVHIHTYIHIEYHLFKLEKYILHLIFLSFKSLNQ